MMRGFARRGQPLLALVLVLGGWVSARAMMWDGKSLPTVRQPAAVQLAGIGDRIDAWASDNVGSDAVPPAEGPVSIPERGLALSQDGTWERIQAAPASSSYITARSAPIQGQPLTQILLDPAQQVIELVPASFASGHQMQSIAAMASIPLPANVAALQPSSAASRPFYPAGSEPLKAAARRWSADDWLLWRRGSRTGLAGGILTPSYGASQAGVVLRYRLSTDNVHRPAVYLRTTAALNGSDEREVALGLSARPMGHIPLVLAGEARLTSTAGRRMVRPAVFAITEFPPYDLPLGVRGELYAQGGYVGGRFATGFADGQLRLDRSLLKFAGADLRFGGGAWGGVQKGASRLDAGPALSIGKPLGGPASVRVSADWRFRVAGEASPGSGPAVTVSAGF